MGNIFIRRPIFAMVIAIMIVVLGLIGIQNTPIEQYPDITPPMVQVSADYQGADALTDGRKALPHSGRHRRQAHHRPSGQTRVRVFGSGLFSAIGQHHQSAKLRFGQIGARTKILPDTAHMVHHSEQPCGLRYVLFQDRTSFRCLIVRKAND